MSLYVKTESSKRSRRSKKAVVPGGAETSQRSLETEENGEELLPGIPDAISLGLIVPKLSWRTTHILAAVSRRWLHIIRSHQVYDSRVYSHCTETFVVLVSYTGGSALYSMKHNYFIEIPPIPRLDSRTVLSCHCVAVQCVAVDGRLYVFKLGGEITKRNCSSVEVYALDLAGQRRQWQYCGNMQEPRYGFGYGKGFGYGAPDGKFYIFKHGSASEVYDPESRTWSLKKPMPSLRYDHQVANLGDELLVYGGKTCDKSIDAECLEVYNPVKDEWRVVGHFRSSPLRKKPLLFTAHGKIYAMTGEHIFVHGRSWRKTQRCCYPGIFGSVDPIIVGAVDDELLAGINWYKRETYSTVSYLVRSQGFRKHKVIYWEKVKRYDPLAELLPTMVPIQL